MSQTLLNSLGPTNTIYEPKYEKNLKKKKVIPSFIGIIGGTGKCYHFRVDFYVPSLFAVYNAVHLSLGQGHYCP